MAHREGSAERSWRCQLSASRSPPNLCPALPRLWGRVRTDSVPLGTRFGSDHRTLSRLQAEDSISGKRSYRYRANYLRLQGFGKSRRQLGNNPRRSVYQRQHPCGGETASNNGNAYGRIAKPVEKAENLIDAADHSQRRQDADGERVDSAPGKDRQRAK